MTRVPTVLLAVLVAATVAAPASAITPGEMFADPAKEARARAIGKQLRCLVCQNQSIFDSSAGLAKDLRMVVRERIAAGNADAAILAFVAERYGDYVLLEPPVKGSTYALWAAPLVLLAGAAGLGAAYLQRRRVVPDAALGEAESAAARRLLKGSSP